ARRSNHGEGERGGFLDLVRRAGREVAFRSGYRRIPRTNLGPKFATRSVVPPAPSRGPSAQTPCFDGRGPIEAAQYAQPTSHPRRWGRRIPRKWIGRLEPRISKRHRKGAISPWTRTRRLILAWWPWSIACLYALVTDRWFWAVACGCVALIN